LSYKGPKSRLNSWFCFAWVSYIGRCWHSIDSGNQPDGTEDRLVAQDRGIWSSTKRI
jgi:hypothetical protein